VAEDTPGAPFEGQVLVRRLRWSSDETGFAVVEADCDGDEIVLVGAIAHLEERERVRVAGVWQDDRRFGMQVKVATAEPLAPSGDEALTAYLQRVKHIGSRRAARLLARHGDAVLEAIDREPHAAFRSVGLNPRRTGEAVASWNALRATRALHLALAPARPGVARAADRQALRRGGARRRPPAAV
jgi:exodeoxyribonuclease V alpha subunit